MDETLWTTSDLADVTKVVLEAEEESLKLRRKARIYQFVDALLSSVLILTTFAFGIASLASDFFANWKYTSAVLFLVLSGVKSLQSWACFHKRAFFCKSSAIAMAGAAQKGLYHINRPIHERHKAAHKIIEELRSLMQSIKLRVYKASRRPKKAEKEKLNSPINV